MGYPVVIYEYNVSKLPAIEHHVLPHYIPDVLQIGSRYLAAVTKAGVKPHPHGTAEGEEDVFSQPVHPGENVILEYPQTPVDAIKLTGKHGPMEHLCEATREGI